jgi:hypothetical protein
MLSLNVRSVFKWLPFFVMILLNCQPAFAEENCVLLSDKKITGGCVKSEVNITFTQKKFDSILSFKRGMSAKPLELDINFGGCSVHLKSISEPYNTLYIVTEDGEPAASSTEGMKIKGSSESIEFYTLDSRKIYTKQCSLKFTKKDDKFWLLTKMALDPADRAVYLQFNGNGAQFQLMSKDESDKADGAMMIVGVVWWVWILIIVLVLLLLSSLIGLLIYCSVFRKNQRKTVSDQSHVASESTPRTPVKEVPSLVVVSAPKSVVRTESIGTVKSKMGEMPKEEVKPKKSIKRDKTRSFTADEGYLMGDANLVRMDDQDQGKSVQIQGF